MNLVTLENVSKQYSDRVLLDQVNLQINVGDRFGLIGINGSGKTTLLQMIAGEEPPDEGEITVWGGVRIQYLPQEPRIDDDLSVLDSIFQSDSPQLQLLRDYERVSWKLQQDPEDASLQAELIALSDDMDRRDGWAAEANAKAVLTRLGITDFDAQISTLSGGQHKRVALARALLDPADLLMLDEPTNHIDADTIAWLEAYLLEVPKALLMVTHDRYFLDRVVNQIVELDRQKLVSYPGNYSRYLEQSSHRHQQLLKTEERRRSHLRKELEWLRRTPMARGTKSKARQQRIESLRKLRYDSQEDRVSIALGSRRLGKKVLRVESLAKSFEGEPVFSEVDFRLEPGDRIGIIGPNGVGKTTFLDILAGRRKPDEGKVVWGETVHLGYFDQRSHGLEDHMRVIEFIESTAPVLRTKDGERVEAWRMLSWFLFSPKEQQARVGSLSGGERRRLYLLYTLAHRPNVLLMDEPTNNLDIQTLNVLEEFLDNFRGCLIAVSHDRYFLDRTVDYLVSFEEQGVSGRYPGPYEMYRRRREAEKRQGKSVKREMGGPSTNGSREFKRDKREVEKRTLNWREQQEHKHLESHIETLETRKEEIEKEMHESGRDYQRLQTLVEALEEIKTELESALSRWLELEDRKD